MSAWLFIFGRTHELSLFELAALVHSPITRITPDVAEVQDLQEGIVPDELINCLGGTVKIARVKGSTQSLDVQMLASFFEDDTELHTFGVSVYGHANTIDTEMLRSMKEILAARGIRARYVLPHDGNTLSSVVVTKQHVRELILVATQDGFIVGETVAVQDFEAWNQRDYGRPYADPKAGMLPPKVARMAVNIGMSNAKCQMLNEKPILLDPFCGMGTILGEAWLTGWNIIGSDQSEEVVDKAGKNLEWLVRMTGSRPVMKLFISDATHVSDHVAQASVDAIVTEPFMGPALGGNDQFPISNDQIKNIFRGLEKLYIGCLRDWHGVLKTAGKIVIALPEYSIGGKTFFVKNVIDRCENLGYTVTRGPLDYGREHAIVRRKFFVFQKK